MLKSWLLGPCLSQRAGNKAKTTLPHPGRNAEACDQTSSQQIKVKLFRKAAQCFDTVWKRKALLRKMVSIPSLAWSLVWSAKEIHKMHLWREEPWGISDSTFRLQGAFSGK